MPRGRKTIACKAPACPTKGAETIVNTNATKCPSCKADIPIKAKTAKAL